MRRGYNSSLDFEAGPTLSVGLLCANAPPAAFAPFHFFWRLYGRVSLLVKSLMREVIRRVQLQTRYRPLGNLTFKNKYLAVRQAL